MPTEPLTSESNLKMPRASVDEIYSLMTDDLQQAIAMLPARSTYDAHKGDPDNKWVIPAAGNWSIRIDIQNTTISFKQL